MKFEIPLFGAAVIFTILAMGILGMFVFLPIACIQYTWNSFMTQVHLLPLINAWQAALLYVALGLAIYISGWVSIEFKSEKVD